MGQGPREPRAGVPRGRESFLEQGPSELGLDGCVGVCSLQFAGCVSHKEEAFTVECPIFSSPIVLWDQGR